MMTYDERPSSPPFEPPLPDLREINASRAISNSFLAEREAPWKEGLQLYNERGWEDISTKHHVLSMLRSFNVPTHPAMERIFTFFDTVTGFHEGNLDFTGRHEPRYRAVKAVWDEFYGAFERLLACYKNTQALASPNGRGMSPQAKEMLNEFVAAWGVPGIVEFDTLSRHTSRVLTCLQSNPQAHIQQTSLLNLPTELLGLVMAHASPETSRMLGSTCRRLHVISIRHANTRRQFTFHFYPNWDISKLFDADFRIRCAPHLRKIAKENRRALLDKFAFLLLRPDITTQIRDLTIYNDSAMKFELEEVAWHGNSAPFYAAVVREAAAVVNTCTNVTKLLLSWMPLTVKCLVAVTSLLWLDTISIGLDKGQVPWDEILQISPSHSVRDVELRADVWEPWAAWGLLALFPSVRKVNICCSGKRRLQMDEEIIPRFPTLPHLQHLHVFHFHLGYLLVFCDWLRAAAPRSLTHFRLVTELGLVESELAELLDALSVARLEVLDLEGVRFVGQALFDQLAMTQPDLQALTLIYRQNDRQRIKKATLWPYASWELAPMLGQLRNLRYFGCNFHVQEFDLVPITLLNFENGFANYDETERGQVWVEDQMTWEQWEQWVPGRLLYCDDDAFARVLAAYTPRLETVFLHEERCRVDDLRAFEISRPTTGPRARRMSYKDQTSRVLIYLPEDRYSDGGGRWPYNPTEFWRSL